MAGRLAADVPGRARLRLQVEHGLDARHARLLPAGPDLPPLPPPRADVQPDVRVQRELHPAAVARRGRPRQGLAVPEDGRRDKLAEAREPARAVRATCGRTRARSCCSWAASWPRRASGATSARSTGTCSSSRVTPASRRSCATSTGSTRTSPRCGSSTPTRPGSGGWSPTTPTATCSRSRARPRTASAWSCSPPTCRRSRARATASGCRGPARWRKLSTPTRGTTAAATWATSARRARADPMAQPACVGARYPAALGSSLARARIPVSSTISAPTGDGVAEYPWERPLGARPRADGGVEFRVWAPRAQSVSLRLNGHDRPAGRRRVRNLRDGRRGARRRRLRVRARRPRAARSVLAVAAGRHPRTVPSPRHHRDPRGAAPPPAADGRARDLRITCWDFLGRRDVRCRHRALCRAGGARRHRDRDHARGRVPGPPWLGLRRRVHLRRAIVVRRPARARPISDGSPRRRPGGHPRRRLQPRRRLGDAGARGVRPVLHRQVRDAVGERDQLRRRRVRPGPRVGAPERDRMDPRLRHRRAAARRDPRDLRSEPRAHRGRGGPARPRRFATMRW